MAARFSLVVLFLLMLIVLPSHAQSLVIDADAQYTFADACFKAGNYEQAANEFGRFVHFFPNDVRRTDAEYKIGFSRCSNGQFSDAENAFKNIIIRSDSEIFVTKAYFMIYECRLKSNDRPGARAALLELIHRTKEDNIRDEAWYRLAWFWIENASWQHAKEALGNISTENRERYQSEEILAEIKTANDLPRKRPAVAGMLSVLPGAGHLYCGRFQDAAVAFFLNTALIGSALEAFDHDLPWLGGVITLAETGVFSGTIYSAVSSAHKFNQRQTRNFIDQLKHREAPILSIGLVPGGAHLALGVEF